jgi:hypothetical protein
MGCGASIANREFECKTWVKVTDPSFVYPELIEGKVPGLQKKDNFGADFVYLLFIDVLQLRTNTHFMHLNK